MPRKNPCGGGPREPYISLRLLMVAPAQEAGQIGGGTADRPCDRGRGSRGDDAAPLIARSRADIDDPVTTGDHAHVVLDDDHGVAGFKQAVELHGELFDIRRVQTSRRLVEHAEGVAALRALQLGCQFDPLRLAAGELGGRLPESQVPALRVVVYNEAQEPGVTA